MAYRVINRFTDKVTGRVYEENQIYHGDDAERLEELSTSKNSQKKPLIRKVAEDVNELNHVGGGYYELSNGERVRGKEEALKAEQELRG